MQEAYDKFAKGIVLMRKGQEEKATPYFEEASSEVQFFGTPEEIGLIHKLFNQIESKKRVDFNDILFALRNDLRREIQLPEIDSAILHVSWHKPSDTSMTPIFKPIKK